MYLYNLIYISALHSPRPCLWHLSVIPVKWTVSAGSPHLSNAAVCVAFMGCHVTCCVVLRCRWCGLPVSSSSPVMKLTSSGNVMLVTFSFSRQRHGAIFKAYFQAIPKEGVCVCVCICVSRDRFGEIVGNGKMGVFFPRCVWIPVVSNQVKCT